MAIHSYSLSLLNGTLSSCLQILLTRNSNNFIFLSNFLERIVTIGYKQNSDDDKDLLPPFSK